MIELGFEHSDPMLLSASNYVLSKLNNGLDPIIREMELQSIDPILTNLASV